MSRRVKAKQEQQESKGSGQADVTALRSRSGRHSTKVASQNTLAQMAFSMSMSASTLGASSAFMGSKLRARAPVRVAPRQKVAARAASIPGEQLVRR